MKGYFLSLFSHLFFIYQHNFVYFEHTVAWRGSQLKVLFEISEPVSCNFLRIVYISKTVSVLRAGS